MKKFVIVLLFHAVFLESSNMQIILWLYFNIYTLTLMSLNIRTPADSTKKMIFYQCYASFASFFNIMLAEVLCIQLRMQFI